MDKGMDMDKAVDMVVGTAVDKAVDKDMVDYYNNYFCHLTKKGQLW